ncbi:hypothetical protein NFI96_004354 [Prochilodus magdalenae]|nr:hypothetical protein NFI96_004354 [Prochilodus magdalenae]
MQRERKVGVREAISALGRLLSALGVESVPAAEAFRRAKFNKSEAVDPQLVFVKSALWYTGYGGWWMAPSCTSIEEIGSRDLLLALGWVMSSENLLEFLLGEKVLELELLSSAHGALCLSGSGVDGAGGGDVRSLQWHYGKLRLQWRNLLAAQQEQAKLTHKILSNMCSSPPETSAGGIPKSTGPTGLDKDLERIRSLNGILEAYLEWKAVEPMFWCWMDSVMDSYLSDDCREGSANTQLSDRSVTQSCSHDDRGRRSMKQLDEMLLRLQAELKSLGLNSQDRRAGATQLSQEQKEKVEGRVAARLRALSRANTPTATTRGFLPCLQEPQASRSTRRPQEGDLSQEVSSGKLQASSALRELKEREAVLQWELELLRMRCRKQIQRQASAQEGLVLIPPLKK